MKHLFAWLALSLFALTATAQNSTLRLMSYNIHNGIGMDRITDYTRISDVINNVKPDVVAIQEADSVTTRSKGADVMLELGKQTGMRHYFSRAIDFAGGSYGIGLLSREEPLSLTSRPLPGTEEARTMLVAEFKDYVVICAHLSLTEADRMTSADILGEEAAKWNKPVFLAGDWNMKPDSKPMEKIKKHFTPLNNMELLTFPADKPDRCIDYISVDNRHKKSTKVKTFEVVDERLASDHRPIVADIELK